MVFHETPAARRARGATVWTIRCNFPPLAPPLLIREVSQFVYIGVAVDPTFSFDNHCTKVLLSIQVATNHLIFAREATPNLRTHSALILYRLWLSTVAVHALSNLLPLRTKPHLSLLQVALNASLSRIFSVPTASIRFLHVEFGFPPTPTSLRHRFGSISLPPCLGRSPHPTLHYAQFPSTARPRSLPYFPGAVHSCSAPPTASPLGL